jgi:hypothetical protein
MIKHTSFSAEINNHEEGIYHALWDRLGSNPGPWDTKQSALTTALLAASQHKDREIEEAVTNFKGPFLLKANIYTSVARLAGSSGSLPQKDILRYPHLF